jgi:subtilisin family serine protease
MDGTGKKSSFSNYGKKTVHVFAPGKHIYSTVKNGGYQKMSGTSMACPHVAGAIGLLLGSEPNLSPLEIRERIVATAVQSRHLTPYAQSGRLDAYRLLKDLRD